MADLSIQNQPKLIRQAIFEVTKGVNYTFDIDETTTFYELKKILCNAAHLKKGCFKVYHNDEDYTYNFDDHSILNLFPNEQRIYFTLLKTNNFDEEEDFSIKLQTNSPCEIHEGKYLIFYCYTCKKSICKNCFDENHQNHNVKEKYDYLAPTKLLVDRIFSDSIKYYANENYDKTFSASELKERLNRVLFEQLKSMITQITNKLNDVIDYFNDCVVETRENTNENIIRLKDFSIDAYKALKADINTNKIMINDDIFLTLDQKIKEIEDSKTVLKQNADKYLEINMNFENIKTLVNQIYSDIFTNLNNHITSPIYYQLKDNIRKSLVHPISKDDIMKKMFSNVKVARKSLNQKDSEMSQLLSSNISNNNNQSMTINIENNQIYQTQKMPTNEYSYNQTPNNIYYNTTNKFQNQNYQNSPMTNYNISQRINIIQDNSNSKTTNETKSNNFSQSQNKLGFIENLNKQIINTGSKNSIIDETIELQGKNSKIIDKRNPKLKSDIFIYPIPLTQNIFILNILGCEEKKIDFPSISGMSYFLDKSAFCNYQNKLYVSGGIDKNNLFSTTFLKYENGGKSIILNHNLLKSRANHSMIAYNKNIYVIGGIGTNKCEKYNEIKWESMPDLIEKEVQLPMLYIYKDYLYSFGGLNKSGILSSVERINLRNNKSKWEFVDYLNPDNIDIKVIGCGLFEQKNELLFIGGKKGKNILKSSFKFNFLNNTYYPCNFSYDTNVYFKESPFIEIDEKIYANINEYDRSPLYFPKPESI